jgi:hypothetical protein
MHYGNGDKEKEWWKCDGVSSLMFLCCFLLFGMNDLEWILLNTSLMWSKGAAKQWGVNKILAIELKKEERGK